MALGSHTIDVVGPDGTDCVFTYKKEIEGGYSIERCRIAKSAGFVRIGGGDAPANAPGACTLIKTGTFWEDMRESNRRAQHDPK